MTWLVTVTPERPEIRWCLCGIGVFGTEKERQTLLATHWASDLHKERVAAKEAKT